MARLRQAAPELGRIQPVIRPPSPPLPEPEVTLGGYFARHERAPAFGGRDGEAYSVEIWVDEVPDRRGRFGASLLFVRWSPTGDRPLGTVESPPLAWGASREEADTRIRALSLYDVKEALDAAIAARPVGW